MLNPRRKEEPLLPPTASELICRESLQVTLLASFPENIRKRYPDIFTADYVLTFPPVSKLLIFLARAAPSGDTPG